MRLKPKEVLAIIKAFDVIFFEKRHEIYLFGSRANDSKKGGDIDLLVVVEAKLKTLFIENKTKVILKIFETLDEQKIDITIATPDEIEKDAFLKSISDSKVRLN